MNIKLLAAQLQNDEGQILHAYQDSLGYWTIGVGVCIDARVADSGITSEESDYLLANRIQLVETQLKRNLSWFDTLDDVRQRVLANMTYQLGLRGVLNFKKTLEFVGAGDYDAASDEMLNSDWAKQTPARAHRLSVMMKIGQDIAL